MVRKSPRIPTRALLGGCELCLANAAKFADEADLLLRKGLRQHAFGLVILGFQELGKFGMLLENYVNATDQGAKEVVVNGFYDHKIKMKARMKHYRDSERDLRQYESKNKDFAKLTKEERHWKRIFESKSFGKTVQMLERRGEVERLAATYVDYDQVRHRWIPPNSPREELVEAHRRLLFAEVIALGTTLHLKTPEIALMAWKAQNSNKAN
jgi:AbiV family abortive infection protein